MDLGINTNHIIIPRITLKWSTLTMASVALERTDRKDLILDLRIDSFKQGGSIIPDFLWM